jgi:hypothetical protein
MPSILGTVIVPTDAALHTEYEYLRALTATDVHMSINTHRDSERRWDVSVYLKPNESHPKMFAVGGDSGTSQVRWLQFVSYDATDNKHYDLAAVLKVVIDELCDVITSAAVTTDPEEVIVGDEPYYD